MVKIKVNLAHRKNYGGERALSKIKYIVIHYTANDGDHDESNANYFKNNIKQASAHYFVDGDSITQNVLDNYVAYSVGGAKWADCPKTGGGKFYNVCTNNNSISVELCDEVKNGKSDFTEATLKNAADLVKMLMKKYNIDSDHVIRHFDVNGKHCPKPMMGDSPAWVAFKKRLEEYTVEKLNIVVDGKKHEVNRVLVGQNNFIKIRDIAPLLGYDVDSVKGVVTLTKK